MIAHALDALLQRIPFSSVLAVLYLKSQVLVPRARTPNIVENHLFTVNTEQVWLNFFVPKIHARSLLPVLSHLLKPRLAALTDF